MPAFCGFSYEAQAGGDVAYRPVRALASRGFGPLEVHPQKLKHVENGCVDLRHNGDWLVVDRDGSFLAFKPERGGRASAERLAALNNGSLPTRIVDLSDEESISVHTCESVQGELDVKAN